MATISFSVKETLYNRPAEVWEALVDWSAHGAWVPLTTVEVDLDDRNSFTAWSGIGHQGWGRRFCLEDRMLATDLSFTPEFGGVCKVAKCGPLLFGTVDISLQPDSHNANLSHVTWFEDIECRWIPSFAAPAIGRLAAFAFRRSLRRLDGLV